MAKPSVKTVSIDSLLLEPNNARVRGARAKKTLGASLEKYGAARSVVADADGVIRAGNGTLEAARAAGIEEALVIETNGKQLVVVKRSDWDEETAIRYGISDNQSALLAEYDPEILANILSSLGGMEQSGDDLLALGFLPHEMEPLLLANWEPPEASGDLVSFQTKGDKAGTIDFDEAQWEKLKGLMALVADRTEAEDPAGIVLEAFEGWLAQ